MIYLCDEGVDREIVSRLRSDGYQVLYIAEMSPSISDEAVLAVANARGAVLITMDKDFGELVFRLERISVGVVLVRLPDMRPAERAVMVSGLVREHESEFPGAFTVLSAHKVRIRRHDRTDH